MKHRVVLMLTGCVAPNIKNDVLAVTDINTRKKLLLSDKNRDLIKSVG